ncbi:RecQ family ATP-dependent DNA helicase, partial [Hydrogenimonas sp.]
MKNGDDTILFLDLEVTHASRIAEIGLVVGDDELCTASLKEALSFLEKHQVRLRFLCGHNLVDFDDRYLTQSSLATLLNDLTHIDTLAVSTLFFSEKTFHKLPKTYKSEDDFKNNPLKDALLTRELFEKTREKFLSLERHLQNSLYTLTHLDKKFTGFYDILSKPPEKLELSLLKKILLRLYEDTFIDETVLEVAIARHPVELAYIVALLTPIIESKAHPPRVLHEYPDIVKVHRQLTLSKTPNDLTEFSEQTFGFATFREFPRLDPSLHEGTTLSQREIVEAALKEESFIAVLPTGGGKTFTFWLPALYRARRTKALTVVISPLQALMRDHIESFNRQVANFTAVAISGYQNALERSDAIDKVISGEADVLYLAPESLRSETIFRMLKNRLIDRFVIDEAHCLSTWGHDFRHDYFFIAEFITDLLDEQPWQESLPVSCFTATAKPDVVEDITRYFGERLGLKMARYLARPERINLTYESLPVEKEEEKYLKLLEILNKRPEPALVYIPSSTRKCDEIAERLATDIAPRSVAAFHAKLDGDKKAEILQGYLSGAIDVIVATTAFGMGVDKPDIRTVIHYEVSDSLENYAQEAGRGARDKNLEALCPILFDEKDLDKHFNQLNRTKLNTDEVNAIFRVLKRQKSDKVILT